MGLLGGPLVARGSSVAERVFAVPGPTWWIAKSETDRSVKPIVRATGGGPTLRARIQKSGRGGGSFEGAGEAIGVQQPVCASGEHTGGVLGHAATTEAHRNADVEQPSCLDGIEPPHERDPSLGGGDALPTEGADGPAHGRMGLAQGEAREGDADGASAVPAARNQASRADEQDSGARPTPVTTHPEQLLHRHAMGD